ncbi:MAG: response regulator [Alphaproteobacteria bacterium]|nr:response regulator [Alphaproteobacteria bacterium]
MAKILVVDDDEGIRDLLHLTLVDAGHVVSVVGDGVAGLSEFRKSTPDLLIADLVMPGGEGITLINAVREEAPRCLILAISGSLHADVFLPSAIRRGADLALGKPVRPDALVQQVAELLRRRGLS